MGPEAVYQSCPIASALRVWLAALVLQHNLVLHARDRHFDHLPQIVRVQAAGLSDDRDPTGTIARRDARSLRRQRLSLLTTATAFPATMSARPPRSAAWTLIAGAAAAVLLVGLTTTALMLSRLSPERV